MKKEKKSQVTSENGRITYWNSETKNLSRINRPKSGQKKFWGNVFSYQTRTGKLFELSCRNQYVENETNFLKTLFGALSIISLTLLKTKVVSYFRKYEDPYWLRKLGRFQEVSFATKKAKYSWTYQICQLYINDKTSDLIFTEAVQLLTEFFSPKMSLFHKSHKERRWRLLNLH